MSKIITGIRTTGELHIGNYFGSAKKVIDRINLTAKGHELFLFLADLHAITTSYNPSTFKDKILNTIKVYIAGGFNFETSGLYLFQQSQIAAHSQLAWLLLCNSSFGELQKMPQFKEKSNSEAGKKAMVTSGLLNYPVLMAADILLYNIDYIPVGDDQKQHLDYTRDLAQRINNRYGEVFKVPAKYSDQLEFFGEDEGLRIRSLQNPKTKMSKSVSDPKGTISLLDDPKLAAKKIKSAVTDTLEYIDWDWNARPGITNLLQLKMVLTGQTKEEVLNQHKGQTMYGPLKTEAAELVEKFLTGFQAKYNSLNDEEVLTKLAKASKKAEIIANQTLARTQKAMGF